MTIVVWKEKDNECVRSIILDLSHCPVIEKLTFNDGQTEYQVRFQGGIKVFWKNVDDPIMLRNFQIVQQEYNKKYDEWVMQCSM